MVRIRNIKTRTEEQLLIIALNKFKIQNLREYVHEEDYASNRNKAAIIQNSNKIVNNKKYSTEYNELLLNKIETNKDEIQKDIGSDLQIMRQDINSNNVKIDNLGDNVLEFNNRFDEEIDHLDTKYANTVTRFNTLSNNLETNYMPK
jgi:hypothetical protein